MVLFILNCSLEQYLLPVVHFKKGCEFTLNLFTENQFHSIKEVVCTFHGFVFKTDRQKIAANSMWDILVIIMKSTKVLKW